jgi:diacylglycerol kinase (ATP)
LSDPPDPGIIPPDENPFKGRKGMARLVQAFASSLGGIQAAFRHESAFRQEVIAAVILLPIAAFVDVTIAERALLVGSVLLLLIVELLNSAIENAIDRIGYERHELSKRSKEMGSAAVMLALALLVFVWMLILLPRFLHA